MSPRASSPAHAARLAHAPGIAHAGRLAFVTHAAAVAIALAISCLGGGCDGRAIATAAAPAADATTDADPTDTGDDAASADAGTDGGADAAPDDAALATSCPPPASTACVAPAPSFAATVLPIFNQRCNTCHDPSTPGAPWPLDNYLDVSEWSALVAGNLVNCAMPPADGGMPFPDAERQQVLAWLACGAPNN